MFLSKGVYSTRRANAYIRIEKAPHESYTRQQVSSNGQPIFPTFFVFTPTDRLKILPMAFYWVKQITFMIRPVTSPNVRYIIEQSCADDALIKHSKELRQLTTIRQVKAIQHEALPMTSYHIKAELL